MDREPREEGGGKRSCRWLIKNWEKANILETWGWAVLWVEIKGGWRNKGAGLSSDKFTLRIAFERTNKLFVRDESIKKYNCATICSFLFSFFFFFSFLELTRFVWMEYWKNVGFFQLVGFFIRAQIGYSFISV